MTALAMVTTLLLTAIGLMHFYWASGGTAGLERAIPTHNAKPLIRPGRLLTLFVGIVLIGFAALTCVLRFAEAVPAWVVYLGWLTAALFVLRAVGEFNAVGFFKRLKGTGFAEYDTKYYAPLSLFIGTVLALLTAARV